MGDTREFYDSSKQQSDNLEEAIPVPKYIVRTRIQETQTLITLP